ncbi:unnamed protein product, partial [Amoebophrya sp. A120]
LQCGNSKHLTNPHGVPDQSRTIDTLNQRASLWCLCRLLPSSLPLATTLVLVPLYASATLQTKVSRPTG